MYFIIKKILISYSSLIKLAIVGVSIPLATTNNLLYGSDDYLKEEEIYEWDDNVWEEADGYIEDTYEENSLENSKVYFLGIGGCIVIYILGFIMLQKKNKTIDDEIVDDQNNLPIKGPEKWYNYGCIFDSVMWVICPIASKELGVARLTEMAESNSHKQFDIARKYFAKYVLQAMHEKERKCVSHEVSNGLRDALAYWLPEMVDLGTDQNRNKGLRGINEVHELLFFLLEGGNCYFDRKFFLDNENLKGNLGEKLIYNPFEEKSRNKIAHPDAAYTSRACQFFTKPPLYSFLIFKLKQDFIGYFFNSFACSSACSSEINNKLFKDNTFFNDDTDEQKIVLGKYISFDSCGIVFGKTPPFELDIDACTTYAKGAKYKLIGVTKVVPLGCTILHTIGYSYVNGNWYLMDDYHNGGDKVLCKQVAREEVLALKNNEEYINSLTYKRVEE